MGYVQWDQGVPHWLGQAVTGGGGVGYGEGELVLSFAVSGLGPAGRGVQGELGLAFGRQ